VSWEAFERIQDTFSCSASLRLIKGGQCCSQKTEPAAEQKILSGVAVFSRWTQRPGLPKDGRRHEKGTTPRWKFSTMSWASSLQGRSVSALDLIH
jgi:hypothetical protein